MKAEGIRVLRVGCLVIVVRFIRGLSKLLQEEFGKCDEFDNCDDYYSCEGNCESREVGTIHRQSACGASWEVAAEVSSHAQADAKEYTFSDPINKINKTRRSAKQFVG